MSEPEEEEIGGEWSSGEPCGGEIGGKCGSTKRRHGSQRWYGAYHSCRHGQNFQNSETHFSCSSLSLSLSSLRDNREDVSYNNQHRTFMRCPDVAVTLMDPTLFYFLHEYLNANMGFPIFHMLLLPAPHKFYNSKNILL